MLLLAIAGFQKQLETISGLDVPLVRLGITALLIAIAAAQSPCAVFCFYAEASEEGTFTDVEGESIRCIAELTVSFVSLSPIAKLYPISATGVRLQLPFLTS